jgi:GLPGLI family protein
MKKKAFIFFTFILFTFLCQGQQLNGKITYKINNSNLSINTDTIKNHTVKKLLNKIFTNSKDTEGITFELVFNKEKSFFKYIEQLEASDLKINLHHILAKTNGKIFSTHKFSLNKSSRYDLLIKDSYSDYKWKLINESKKIGGIICYKATGIKTTFKTKKNIYRKSKITAWYAPEINVPFGPSGFGGLPGLILELTDGKLTNFYASKINLKKKKKVKSPPKIKVIEREKFNELKRKQYLGE